MKRLLKTVYVDDEDTARQIDAVLEAMRAVGAEVDYDPEWEEEEPEQQKPPM